MGKLLSQIFIFFDDPVAPLVKIGIVMLIFRMCKNMPHCRTDALICTHGRGKSRYGVFDLAVVKDDGAGLVAGQTAL